MSRRADALGGLINPLYRLRKGDKRSSGNRHYSSLTRLIGQSEASHGAAGHANPTCGARWETWIGRGCRRQFV
jgi:hypothetical protein